ncbi:hypothetical protein Y88_0706 [Novosphingobium nitrogenifigens DSM 19370]|uniref:Elongation factor P n=1 Tax=Novosphingobium nitrogenifigens DSM 19370 TaxID=983920 RepID=F1Z9U2_9SPHN|nr:hypothetical protein [Novosphingobium nitrogenifigens]EGD58649.1 hypothetical protein Y88_0706 [Novosphingobium nitrogenifigens DSM 19370]
MKSIRSKAGLALSPALCALVLLATPGTATAAPGGSLRVLLRGPWICEVPGDASTPPKTLPKDSFHAQADSSYRLPDGSTGTYLLLGNHLVMTTGPFRGRTYETSGQGMIYPLDANGTRTGVRCIRHSNITTDDNFGVGSDGN